MTRYTSLEECGVYRKRRVMISHGVKGSENWFLYELNFLSL